LYNFGAPSECISVYVLGPLPRTNKGNRYLLMVGDYFSKWSEAIPIYIILIGHGAQPWV
jgi:hypothetical protein